MLGFFNRNRIGPNDIIWDASDLMLDDRYSAVMFRSQYPTPTAIVRIYDRHQEISEFTERPVHKRKVVFDGRNIMVRLEPLASITLDESRWRSESRWHQYVQMVIEEFLVTKVNRGFLDYQYGDGLQIDCIDVGDISLVDNFNCYIKF